MIQKDLSIDHSCSWLPITKKRKIPRLFTEPKTIFIDKTLIHINHVKGSQFTISICFNFVCIRQFSFTIIRRSLSTTLILKTCSNLHIKFPDFDNNFFNFPDLEKILKTFSSPVTTIFVLIHDCEIVG